MSRFVVYDLQDNQDLTEHDRLCDAYVEIDRLSEGESGTRYGVRLARVHRAQYDRSER